MFASRLPDQSRVPTVEALEDRRLCSVSLLKGAVEPAASSGALRQPARASASKAAAVKITGQFEGELLVTRQVATPVTGLAVGSAAPGSVLPVLLTINRQNSRGRVSGTLSIKGLGLAGTVGPFNVSGQVKGDKVDLRLADLVSGTGRLTARITRAGRLVIGTYWSRVSGELTQGKLRLHKVKRTDVQTVLGFQPVTGIVFTTGTFNSGLVISFSA